MTTTPVLEPNPVRRPPAYGSPLPLVLYAFTGFSGLLAEQGFEKYLQLLVGATASGSAAVLLAYLLGFALGAVAAGRFLRDGRISRPLRAFGLVQLAVGLCCVAFSYNFHPLLPALAPLQNLFAGAVKFQVRFLCGCLLVLPTAALMGASFPLLAQALDDSQTTFRKRWPQAYAANLVGALAAAVAAPFFIMPSLGLRGAMWICGATGAAVWGISTFLPDAAAAAPPARHIAFTSDLRRLLAAAFGAGAIVFALEVVWTHLIGVTLGASVYAFSWMLAAVLSGLLVGALLANRSVETGRLVRPSLLFQCATLLLMVQFGLWDRVPAFFRLTPPDALQNFFYFAEAFKLYVAVLLLAPPAAVLGLIYPRLLASPQLQGEPNAYLAGYLSAAHSLGCLSGALLGIFVLVPLAGAEGALKGIVLLVALVWAVLLLREPLTRRRVTGAVVVAVAVVFATLGRWWDWRALTAGLGNYFGQPPVHAETAARYLPPAFVLKHEDVQGGFTTVVEQTVVTGEVARTVRTLFTNGEVQGDDSPAWGEAEARFGYAAVPSLFIPDYGSALLIGLGTGHGAAALKHLGYREIVVAESAPGVVKAAAGSFRGFNEGVLDDPSVHLYIEDGRNLLLTGRRGQYDLIAIEVPSVWFAGATNLYSREFYELAHSRLHPSGVLQQWVQLHHISPREIASQLATAHSVFPYVGLWYYSGQGMIVAADSPLAGPRILPSAGLAPAEAAQLAGRLMAARVLDGDGVARLLKDAHAVVNTDHNRWIEYAAPRYQSSGLDWLTRNLEYLRSYR